jgi:outer membrane receptor protein involved in Fe transport
MKCIFSLLVLAAPVTAFADEADPIIVTGRGLDAPAGDGVYDSVTVPRDRLVLNASGRIEDVLSDVAGFQQFRRTDSRSANPTSQGATLRALGGNASSRALVLLDGVPQADPFTGFIPYAALRPERLSSVRVTRGGGAGAFGVGAVAGTIELFSGGPDELSGVSLRTAYGSRNATEVSGGIAQRLGAGFVTVNGGWDRGDGYILIPENQRGAADIPARYDQWSAALRAVVPLSSALEVQVGGLVFDDHRLRGALGTASRSRGEDASLKIVGRGPWGFEALAYVQDRGFRSGFVSAAPDRFSTTQTLDQFNTPATGLGAKIEIRPPIGERQTLRIGADVRDASGRDNEYFLFVAGRPTKLRRAGGINTTYGAFVEGSAILGPVTLTAGGRVDRWSIRQGFLRESFIGSGNVSLNQVYADRSGTRPTARAGASLRLSPMIDVRAAAYTGFRVPTLNELYRPFRVGSDVTSANGALGIEKLTGYEAAVGLHGSSGARLDITAFDNRLDGAIANVTLSQTPASTQRQRQNVDTIVSRGVEVSATIPVGVFRLGASYAYTDARVRASGIAIGLDGKRPAQTPMHQGSATIAFTPARGLQGSITARYAGPQFDDDLQTRRLPRAVTVDGVVSVPLAAGVRLVARAENVFDERVVSGISSSGIVDLGTPQTFWLGFSFAR